MTWYIQHKAIAQVRPHLHTKSLKRLKQATLMSHDNILYIRR